MRRFHLSGREIPIWLRCGALAAAVLLVVLLTIRVVEREVGVSVQIARSPAFLDPARISSFEEKLVCGALYESLVEYDPVKDRCKGVLAAAWEEDAGGTVYTFTLRKGARFHNGKPLTARDVKYSWERVMNPRLSSYGYLLQNVEGADEVIGGKRRTAAGLVVVDDRTVRVFLKEPDLTFPAVVSSPVLAVVNRELAEKWGDRYGERGTPVSGTGPFYLARWNDGEILLSKNRRHKTAAASLNSLAFVTTGSTQEARRFFASGRVDILTGVPSRFAGELAGDKAVLVKKPVLSFYFLGFNMGQEPFGRKVDLRRGIDRAIDKERLSALLLGESGRPLERLLPPELGGGENSPLREGSGRQEALRFLAEAGHPYGLNLSSFHFAFNDTPGHELLGRLIQEELDKVGVEVDLKKRPWKEYLMELRQGEHSFFRLGWEADYPEAGNILACNFAGWERKHNNLTGYGNERFDSLIKEARKERHLSRRRELYRQAEELILADLPVIPLFQKVAVFVVRKGITGFQVDPLGRIDFGILGRAGELQRRSASTP
ncbi:MAG: peptide/nickel transport system substrate-binding protein [Clostridia bacterium]|nr:peptide/nickel transport system substrate-binding protein [Clostridia bacterium]